MLKKLYEQRAAKEARFEELTKKAEATELTPDEKKEMKGLTDELKVLDEAIESEEAIEGRKKKIAGRNALRKPESERDEDEDDAADKEFRKMAGRYRFGRAFKQIQKKKNLDGVESEIYQMAVAEAKESSEDIQGNIAIPSRMIKIGRQERVLTVATEGTDAVFTDYGGMIPILNPKPALTDMGITVLQGLRGNVQWVRHTGDVAFSWETETADVDETTPTLDNISLAPKRVGGFVDISLQMLKQSVFVVEPWLKGIIENRYQLTIDYAGLVGTGLNNQPTGLFNASGVGVFSTGSGAANNMTYNGLLQMMRDVKAAKARQGKAGWMTNANGEFALAQTPKQTSGVEGNFILNPEAGSLIGRKFVSTEVIPSDFTEGGQTDLVGIAYSTNWPGLTLGTWGGMDLLFDPYTQAIGGKVRTVVNAFMNMVIEQPAEFIICKDWDATDLPAAT